MDVSGCWCRRSINPGKGLLCFPGGFLEEEDWTQGGSREVMEEVSVKINPDRLQPFWFASSFPQPLGRLSSPLEMTGLETFKSNTEVLERGLVFGPQGLDEVMAFPLHAQHFQEKHCWTDGFYILLTLTVKLRSLTHL